MSASISSMGNLGNLDPILGKNLGNRPAKEPGKPSSPAPATKPLWAAIGVLGVSVLAMGATLIHINNRPAEPLPLPLPVSATTGALRVGIAAQPAPTGADGGNSIITETADGKPVVSQPKALDANVKPASKKVAKQAQPGAGVAPSPVRSADVVVAANTSSTGQAPASAQAPSAAPTAGNAPALPSGQPNVVTGTPQAVPTAPVVQAAPAPVVAQVPARAVCANCGTIEAVTPVTRAGKGASGVGTVAGGVLGGVIGHQVGGGKGRDLATVLGAVGGAVAGNAVEKNVKKETVYSVRVHMEDGSTRTIEQATAPAVGAKVRVEGSTLRLDS